MQAQGISAPLEDDDRAEHAVLRRILGSQPTILRMCDLIRELGSGPGVSRDGVERAVRELTKVGLLDRQGECVLPTPAAVYVQGWEL